MKTIIHGLSQPRIDKSEDREAVLNVKNVQSIIDLAHSYVEKDEEGIAQFIADLLNEYYGTEKFTYLCLKS